MAGGQPSKMRKAVKVLSAKQVSPDLSKVYAKNQEGSRLLKLPPELRNRIWMFVLGGQTIHISVAPASNPAARNSGSGRILNGLCSLNTSGASYSEHLKAQDSVGCGTYEEHHQVCMDRKYEPLRRTNGRIMEFDALGHGDKKHPEHFLAHALRLLKTCRQIHEETALLPFSENVFSFESLNELDSFATLMISAQTNAIKHVSVVCGNEMKTPRLKALGLENMKKRMRKLETFIIFVRLHDDYYRHVDTEARLREARTRGDLGRLTEHLFYRKTKLDATVTATITCDPRSAFAVGTSGVQRLAPEEIRQMEKAIEESFAQTEV